MGSYLRCKFCNSNLYLLEQKDELNFPYEVTCNICFNKNVYYQYEITQEKHSYKCSFCSRPFFITKSPPLQVECPHCSSNIYINSDSSLSIIVEGTKPTRDGETLGGLVGGAAIGSLFGPVGTLLGGLLGAVLGHEGLANEAIYLDGS